MGTEEITIVGIVAGLDWSQIEPAIFGTLFERGLYPNKRSIRIVRRRISMARCSRHFEA